MPNYSLVINSTFRPFSYQELLQPALMATEAQHNLEDQYADLESKASIWEGMANEQTDPRTYKRYKDYADELRAAANDLADYGLTPSSRQKLANMRARYSSQIVPIQNAYQTRLEQAKEQRQALNQNPTLMLSRRAATTSLDDYMDNPMLDYQSYSGALLTQQVAQMADKLKGELTSYGSKPLDKFTNLFLQKHGLSSQEVLNAINNPNSSNSAKVLNAMVNDAIESSGINSWADDATMEQAYKYAWQGAWSAVGQTTASPYENKQAVMDYEFAQKEALMDYEHQLKVEEAAAANTPNNEGARYNTRNVLTSKEKQAQSDEISDWNKYKRYFRKNKYNHWEMTPAGRKLASQYYDSPLEGYGYTRIYKNSFAGWAAKHGLTGMVNGHTGPWQSGQINRIDKMSADFYDATKATEYTTLIGPSDYKGVAAALNSVTVNGKLQTYDVSNNKGKYQLVQGKKWDATGDLKDNDISDAKTVVGKHGNYLEVKLKGMKDYIRIPLAEVNNHKNSIINGNLSTLSTYEKLVQQGKKYVPWGNGYIPIEDAITRTLNNASDNSISIFGTTSPKTTEVENSEYYQ